MPTTVASTPLLPAARNRSASRAMISSSFIRCLSKRCAASIAIGQVWPQAGYGQGDVVSAVLPARTELAPHTRDRDQAHAHGAAFLGDSGAGVEDANGRAFGVLVSIGVGVDGVIGITRIEPQRSRASRQLGIGLKLQQADPT